MDWQEGKRHQDQNALTRGFPATPTLVMLPCPPSGYGQQAPDPHLVLLVAGGQWAASQPVLSLTSSLTSMMRTSCPSHAGGLTPTWAYPSDLHTKVRAPAPSDDTPGPAYSALLSTSAELTCSHPLSQVHFHLSASSQPYLPLTQPSSVRRVCTGRGRRRRDVQWVLYSREVGARWCFSWNLFWNG